MSNSTQPVVRAAASSDLRSAIRLAAELALERLEHEQQTPVLPAIEPVALARELDVAIPSEERTLDAVVADLQAVLRCTPATTTPAFFNQLFGGRDPAATLADMLVAVLNTSMYTWKIAAPHVLIERELMRHMCSKVGFSQGSGLFCPGGSMSNLAAMLAARNHCLPEARDAGAGAGHLRCYTSASGHYSIGKAADFIGVGRANVRVIPVDDLGRMLPEALREAIERDLAAGARPCFINATAGTTVEGAFDPIEPIADIAQRAGAWLHVDGAFGGSALLSRTHRPLLAGVERAHSFTWDAHKMMGVPLTCSVALFRESAAAHKHFSEAAEYLFQDDLDEYNPGKGSLQCGRRNDALKLWAMWRQLGDAGFERRVDRQMALAQYAARAVEQDPELSLVLPPQLLTVCFEAPGVSSEAICEHLHREGVAMVGWATVQRKRVIRAAIMDANIVEADIDALLGAIKAAARALREDSHAQAGACNPC